MSAAEVRVGRLCRGCVVIVARTNSNSFTLSTPSSRKGTRRDTALPGHCQNAEPSCSCSTDSTGFVIATWHRWCPGSWPERRRNRLAFPRLFSETLWTWCPGSYRHCSHGLPSGSHGAAGSPLTSLSLSPSWDSGRLHHRNRWRRVGYPRVRWRGEVVSDEHGCGHRERERGGYRQSSRADAATLTGGVLTHHGRASMSNMTSALRRSSHCKRR